MKTVTITRDMRPWRAGDDVHLRGDVADRLVATGEATNARPFPPGSSASQEPERPRYLTKRKRHA